MILPVLASQRNTEKLNINPFQMPEKYTGRFEVIMTLVGGHIVHLKWTLVDQSDCSHFCNAHCCFCILFFCLGSFCRDPEFVSPLRSKPKGPQGSLRWRSDQS